MSQLPPRSIGESRVRHEGVASALYVAPGFSPASRARNQLVKRPESKPPMR